MKENRGAIIAAALILLGFGIVGYFMPRLMLWVGNFSTAAAGLLAAAFVAAFFLVFWFRTRSQKRKEK
ncbi:hypothetical protein [Chelativorans sp.]|uniref:hypothetical protein n=1 Tax=Chelativorans sp. TaxID=2203393 RepID=UPI002811E83F|nr:hypothetical protein [Chelativorans sp.]